MRYELTLERLIDAPPEVVFDTIHSPGHEIGFRWEDVAILPDARDLASAFQFAKRLVQTHPDAALSAQSFPEFGFIERPVFRPGQNAQNFLLQLRSLRSHAF